MVGTYRKIPRNSEWCPQREIDAGRSIPRDRLTKLGINRNSHSVNFTMKRNGPHGILLLRSFWSFRRPLWLCWYLWKIDLAGRGGIVIGIRTSHWPIRAWVRSFNGINIASDWEKKCATASCGNHAENTAVVRTAILVEANLNWKNIDTIGLQDYKRWITCMIHKQRTEKTNYLESL
jgi:hypothetical protein